MQETRILSDRVCQQLLISRPNQKRISLLFRFSLLQHGPIPPKLFRPLSDEDIRTLVFITDGKHALAKDVKTGIQDNNYIEILSGVAEGDRVISAPFSAISKKLSDSTLVEIVKKEDLF